MKPSLAHARSTLVCLLATAGACADSGLGPKPVAQVVVSPQQAAVPALGDTARFRATVIDAAGGEVTDAPIVWSSSNPAVAAVTPQGVATAVGAGSAVVWAEAGGRLGGGVFAVAPDTLAPRLEDVSVDRTRVGVLNQSGDLTVTARLGDDRAGVTSAIAQFTGPSGASITSVVTLTREEGDALAGVWRGPLSVPANTGIGTWRLSLVQAEDEDGNVARWREAELAELGYVVTFEVVWSSG